MAKTSEPRRNAVKSLSAKVTARTYEAVILAAGDKKPSVWLRELVEAHVARGDVETRVLEELCALRYIVLNGLPKMVGESDRAAAVSGIALVRDKADDRKAEKARALLRGER